MAADRVRHEHPLMLMTTARAADFERLRIACLAVAGGDLSLRCGHVATMICGMFGGRIMAGRVDGLPHYWNRLPDGIEIDLTSCQFGGDGYTPLVQGRPIKKPRMTAFEFLVFAVEVGKRL